MRKLIRLSEVLCVRPEGSSTIFREVAAGRLPPPVRVGQRITAYVEHEITASIDMDISANRLKTREDFLSWVERRADQDADAYGSAHGQWYWERARWICEANGWPADGDCAFFDSRIAS